MDNKQKIESVSKPCPECDNNITIDEVVLGKVVECSACGAESEIVSIDPLKLAVLEEEK